MRPTSLVPVLCAMSSLALLLAGCAGGNAGGNGGSFTISLSFQHASGTARRHAGARLRGHHRHQRLGHALREWCPDRREHCLQAAWNDRSRNGPFTASPAAPAGTYTVQIDATGGSQTAPPQSLTLVVAVATVVSNTVDTSLEINGQLKQFMYTSFQPAEWDYQYFLNLPRNRRS